MNSTLIADQISIVRQNKQLLDAVTFKIKNGDINLIMGPNGAGKTLILHCLVGLMQPSSGCIRTGDGLSLTELSQDERNRMISWTPLSQSLPFAFRVVDIVLMGRFFFHQGFPTASDHDIVRQVLVRLNIEGLSHRVYNSLSRGEQTKVDIARAIAADRQIMIFDEPFANLDIDANLQIRKLFLELRAEGRTIIMSHHDLYSVADFKGYIIFVKNGRLIAQGNSSDVYNPELIEQVYHVKVRTMQDSSGNDFFIRFCPIA